MSIFVRGLPASQGTKRQVGHGIMVESSKRLHPWREAIVSECLRAGWADRGMAGAITVDMTFWFIRPASHYGTGKNAERLKVTAPEHMTVKPDADKLARACLDALAQASVFRDDCQVISLGAEKRYRDSRAESPGVHIELGHRHTEHWDMA